MTTANENKVVRAAMRASDSSLSWWAVDARRVASRPPGGADLPGQCFLCLPPPFTRRVTRCPIRRRRRQGWPL